MLYAQLPPESKEVVAARSRERGVWLSGVGWRLRSESVFWDILNFAHENVVPIQRRNEMTCF